jgi:hypothetical protein
MTLPTTLLLPIHQEKALRHKVEDRKVIPEKPVYRHNAERRMAVHVEFYDPMGRGA